MSLDQRRPAESRASGFQPFWARSVSATIYHGTPMTPRSALLDVCAGRAMCVSFFRPDDVEVVEAISPAIMFRQRRLFILAGSTAQGRRTTVDVRRQRLGGLLPMVGAALVASGTVGGNPGLSWAALPAQRWATERLAIRGVKGRARLAHGWTYQSTVAPVRAVRAGLPRLDRQDRRLTGLSCPDGGGCQSAGQPMAEHSYDARNGGSIRLSVHQRGQYLTRTERVAV
jgi:hypothetical protein